MTTETIAAVIEQYGKDREHLMLVLRELERRSGRAVLDRETLRETARQMNLPESALAGFVGFYTLFSVTPRAPYVIRVCASGPCHVMGATTVFDGLKKLLGIGPGEVSADGRFALEACECLGVCSVAPALMVNDDLHGNLDEARLAALIERYRAAEPSPREASGPETAGRACVIEGPPAARRLLARLGADDPCSLDAARAAGGYEALKKALAMSPEAVIGLVKDSGLRGRGGAGFPTGMKWSFVGAGPRKYVICNADEGEPGTFKDRVLMEEDPHLLVEGMAICGYAIGAAHGVIYVRGEYRRSIDRLAAAIARAREGGMLGAGIFGSAFSFDIAIKEGCGSYFCGEETSLINSMEGRRGYPRFKPPFPGAAGFMGLPSNVNNVETLMSVPLIVARGADWYRSMGTPGCSGTKLYCLSGALKRRGLVELPMGATLREIIEVHGQGMARGAFKFAQVGGTAGGILGPDLLDLPLDIDQTTTHGVTLGSGVVLVCGDDVCAVDFLLRALSFFRHESCGQCVPCRTGTATLHELMRRIAGGTAAPGDLDRLTATARLMKQTSLCALGQSPAMPVETMLNYFRHEFEAHAAGARPCPACETARRVYESH